MESRYSDVENQYFYVVLKVYVLKELRTWVENVPKVFFLFTALAVRSWALSKRTNEMRDWRVRGSYIIPVALV